MTANSSTHFAIFGNSELTGMPLCPYLRTSTTHHARNPWAQSLPRAATAWNVFASSVWGSANAGVASGAVDLDELEEDALPDALKPMAPAEQKAYVAELAGKRADLQRQIRELSEDRNRYLDEKVEEAGGMKNSLDQQLYDAVKEQAGEAGLEYRDGPTY